jgi:hypothetical protein
LKIIDPLKIWEVQILGNYSKGKGKGKVPPRTGHKGPEGSRGIAVLFLLSLR